MASGLLCYYRVGTLKHFISVDCQPRTKSYGTKMSLDQKFEAAAEEVKTLTKRPSDEEFLELYALYKQGTIGDNNIPKPGLLDLKGKAKWNAWDGKRGTSQEAAKEAYIAFVAQLVAKYK